MKELREVGNLCVCELEGRHAGTSRAKNAPYALTLHVFEHERRSEEIRSTAITAARVDTVAEHAVHPVGCPSSLDRRRISGPSLRVRNESAALPL